jgi:hypothetical protein
MRAPIVPCAVVMCAVLAGCDTPPAAAPQAGERGTAALVAVPAPPREAPLDELERRWLERLATAERNGQWAQAALALEVLVLLNPRAHQERQAELNKRISQTHAERLQRAQQELAAGRLEAAEQLYLSALALRPQSGDAAQALRAIERTRNKRDYLGQSSRITLTRRYAVPATTAQAAAQLDASMEREHAAMLATQGDTDAAIAILEDQLARDKADRATRSMLVELYVKKAQGLRGQDLPASRAALAQALRLVPDHTGALALMKQLPPPPAKAAP